MFNNFGMTNLKHMSTPCTSHYKLSDEQSPKTIEEKHYIDNIPYTSIVGFVMYIIICTCPNIAYVVSIVSRFMSNPSRSH